MGHLERGLWKTETCWDGNDREQLGKEALGSEEPKPVHHFTVVVDLNYPTVPVLPSQ